MTATKRNNGFTVIELMLTIAVLAVVVTFAIPSFQTMIMNNRISSQANEITSLVSFARSEASKRPDARVTLCPSNDGSSCAGGAAWESGWIAMLDVDGDQTLDAGDGDRVLRVGEPLAGGNTFRIAGFGGNAFIQFDGSGQPVSPGALGAVDGSLVVCDSRDDEFARGVVVMVSGQTRLARDENNSGTVNLHGGGNDVTCP
ncbi:GspH/FimT family pseudopilin [Marinobacter goseongensis]|uniref:GspH/FimT family pseudopilin n=1 Tax=Marinobacter goseongensis TaxID=453838 RepID=UPI002006566A|nr:GspH/FimT family pseudopilin [Marinobacter goseongensis]MCK7552064.1 GspH/FimT family pseudopilin [Marinobacter goseongensis]